MLTSVTDRMTVENCFDIGAANYLRKLDDDLTGAKFDIVDAKTMAEAEKFPSTAELIVAAIND